MDVATNRNNIFSLSYLNMCEPKRKHVASESRGLAGPPDIAYNARAAVPAIITTGLVRISLSLGAVPSYLAHALPPQVLTSPSRSRFPPTIQRIFFNLQPLLTNTNMRANTTSIRDDSFRHSCAVLAAFCGHCRL